MKALINSLLPFVNFLLLIFLILFLQSDSISQEIWNPTSLYNAPSSRIWHTAVWTGSDMIIWGGQSDYIDVNTGGRYNIITNSWSPTSTVNAPEGREIHTAVWTGTKMVIWGGIDYNGSGELNTGGIYDPISDSWVPVDTVNAPSRRYFHTAVWTGSKMIVWGGGIDNTGGIYDPVSNTWQPTSTINAPSPRYWHTAVWTGNKMIIWGGDTLNHNFVNTGGIYDPVNNSWQPTSTINAPSPRIEHSAVWTGSKMIIWGGVDNTGGLYDPENDLWIPVSIINAPAARYVHTAVWTGIKMVLWGGIDLYGSYALQSGGIYDPLSNTWSATTLVNAPRPRYFQRAVWAGQKMIIWGGTDGVSPLFNSGGIYSNPAIIAVNNTGNEIPKLFLLYQNYPNPFNPVTTIKYDLPTDGNVTIAISDVLGREVAGLVKNEFKIAGSYNVIWDATDFPSGVYFYRIEFRQAGSSTGKFVETKKMVLIK